MKIELIYDKECPNVEVARSNLRSALKELGMNLDWIELDRNGGDSPAYARRYGSPTILVNGKDVYCTGAESESNCCRVYISGNALSGAPPIDLIAKAISAELSIERRPRISPILTAIFGSLTAFAPAISCPACWPAYASMLSSLGIGFFNYSPYVTPITFLLIFVTLLSLWSTAKRNHRYFPFKLALIASTLIVVERAFGVGAVALYSGVLLLVVASLLRPDRACQKNHAETTSRLKSEPIKRKPCPDSPTKF